MTHISGLKKEDKGDMTTSHQAGSSGNTSSEVSDIVLQQLYRLQLDIDTWQKRHHEL